MEIAEEGQQNHFQQQERLQQQQHQIADLESNLERAALYGKQLLEQLHLKTVECDDLLEHRTQLNVELEDLRQRHHVAERHAQLASARERDALMEIDMLRSTAEENDRLRDEKRILEQRLRVVTLERERRLQSNNELEDELRIARTQLAIVQAEVKDYEQRESLKPNFSSVEDSTDPVSSPSAQWDAQLAEVLLDDVRQDKVVMESELAYYKNSIQEKNLEITELKGEVDSLKAAQIDPNRRGNSIFAEVEDRRIEVEARLAKMIARLRGAEEVKRRLRSQLAHCFASMKILARHTSQADQHYVAILEKEVMRLRNEVFACSARFSTKSKDETFTEKDLQGNPLAGLLLSERACTAALKKRLEELIVQEDQRTEEIIRLGSQLRKSQAFAEKLNKEHGILQLRLQEKKIAEANLDTDSGSSNDTGSKENSEPNVYREVLREVIEENQRIHASELQIKKCVDQVIGYKAISSSDVRLNDGLPDQSEATQPSTIKTKDQCRKKTALSDKENVPSATGECKPVDICITDRLKKVDFSQDTTNDDGKSESTNEKSRGRQVAVLKKTKAQQNSGECGMQ
ncbi:hypothetical protein BIW11_00259 [Tropilaelaps mercedesae]|uniref:Protein Spindly-like n=1 Tax=Tropilaelaps mercedesae TaxID=418985 RepID=A0A1V9XYY4_9ACAR|nr:hypothetical protein BIW11_00259 [Tropilaelaps mercedesae]